MRAILLLLLLLAAASGTPPEGRIIQGEDAEEGEFPYMASIREVNSTKLVCGGSVIARNWILTAAHCCKAMWEPRQFYVYAGSIYLSRGGQNVTIADVVVHEDYRPEQSWLNDICLIRLAAPFGAGVERVKLPQQEMEVPGGEKVTITGWGRTRPMMTGFIPDRLQKGVGYVVLSAEECRRDGKVDMKNGYLCARGPTREQCTWNGDSGGPLVWRGVQVGLVSFGFRPYGNGLPTIYCRVPHYVDWIRSKLGPDSRDLRC